MIGDGRNEITDFKHAEFDWPMVYVGGVWKYGSQKSGWEEVCVFLLGISVTCSIYTTYEVDEKPFAVISWVSCVFSWK